MHILLIEDDLDLGRALQSALKVEGLTSEWRRRAVDAPRGVDASFVDCILLDLTLPDGSGFDLLARWRREGVRVPIIVITARSAVEDRLAGLDGGADDFVVKPFAIAELISRIRAVLRRTARQASETWTLGDLVIEPRRHQAQRAANPSSCLDVNSSCCSNWRANPVRSSPRACWPKNSIPWVSR